MAGADRGTTAQARRRPRVGTPAAGPEQMVAQPPSPPSEPQPRVTAADREARAGHTARANRRVGRPRVHSTEEMLQALREFREVHGRVPSQVDFNIRRPNASVYKRRFGSWGDALRAAGMEPVYGRPRKRAA